MRRFLFFLRTERGNENAGDNHQNSEEYDGVKRFPENQAARERSKRELRDHDDADADGTKETKAERQDDKSCHVR